MKTYITIIFCFISFVSSGQLKCSGSLGANLFDKGDFGSGNSNNVLVNPQIAPGYNYVTSGPPFDGNYILTNNTGSWGNLYPTWLPLRDNSADPNGYMMVVNASFEPGLFYEEIIEGICENTQFEFSADIINVVKSTIMDHIKPNVAFLIDDKVVLQTGDIAQDERWHSYAFSFTTEPGQSSLKLSLRNNAPGGTGNDLALDNITFRACGPPSKVSINTDKIVCSEDFPLTLTALIENQEVKANFYQWEYATSSNPNWQAVSNANESQLIFSDETPGIYNFRFGFAGSPNNFDNEKCRFFSDPIQINVPERNFEIIDTICGGTGIDIGGLQVTSPGVYVSSLVSTLGCDSVITYYLDTIKRATITGELDTTDPMCYDEANGIVEAFNISGGFAPYRISTDQVESDGLKIATLSAGEHKILVKDRYGCFFEELINLDNPSEFIVDMGEDLNLLLGEEAVINITANQAIQKVEFAPNIDSAFTHLSYTFLPLQDMLLSASVLSESGCYAYDELNITVDQDVSIYIPNAFSPNNDQINDRFKITAQGKSLAYIDQMDIWTRWGERIATAIDPAGWDGAHVDGQAAMAGTYIYHLRAVLINGNIIEQSGSLSLIR
jgi:gliding motility-associated-like protein